MQVMKWIQNQKKKQIQNNKIQIMIIQNKKYKNKKKEMMIIYIINLINKKNKSKLLIHFQWIQKMKLTIKKKEVHLKKKNYKKILLKRRNKIVNFFIKYFQILY